MSITPRTPADIASDALDQLGVCRETLSHLESLLWILKTTLGPSHSGRLAAMGAAVALDRASIVESEVGDWRKELEALEESA